VHSDEVSPTIRTATREAVTGASVVPWLVDLKGDRIAVLVGQVDWVQWREIILDAPSG